MNVVDNIQCVTRRLPSRHDIARAATIYRTVKSAERGLGMKLEIIGRYPPPPHILALADLPISDRNPLGKSKP